MIGLSEKQKDTLEYSFLEFENKQFNKIEKAIVKYKDNEEFSRPLSLTESLLFPSNLRKEIISEMRIYTNEIAYQTFKYHDIFDKISLQPYNIDYDWHYGHDFSESIFIDSFLEIENIITYFYKRLKYEFNKIDIKIKLKSQGIIFLFEEGTEIESLDIVLSNLNIFHDVFFETIRYFRKNNYLSILKIKYISLKDDSSFSFDLDISENCFNEASIFNEDKSGLFNKFEITKVNSYFLYVFISGLLKSQSNFIKNNKNYFFGEKDENSVVYIPKNVNATYLFDFGYFSEDLFRKIIINSSKTFSGFDRRASDFKFMINNFKFIS